MHREVVVDSDELDGDIVVFIIQRLQAVLQVCSIRHVRRLIVLPRIDVHPVIAQHAPFLNFRLKEHVIIFSAHSVAAAKKLLFLPNRSRVALAA